MFRFICLITKISQKATNIQLIRRKLIRERSVFQVWAETPKEETIILSI